MDLYILMAPPAAIIGTYLLVKCLQWLLGGTIIQLRQDPTERGIKTLEDGDYVVRDTRKGG